MLARRQWQWKKGWQASGVTKSTRPGSEVGHYGLRVALHGRGPWETTHGRHAPSWLRATSGWSSISASAKTCWQCGLLRRCSASLKRLQNSRTQTSQRVPTAVRACNALWPWCPAMCTANPRLLPNNECSDDLANKRHHKKSAYQATRAETDLELRLRENITDLFLPSETCTKSFCRCFSCKSLHCGEFGCSSREKQHPSRPFCGNCKKSPRCHPSTKHRYPCGIQRKINGTYNPWHSCFPTSCSGRWRNGSRVRSPVTSCSIGPMV